MTDEIRPFRIEVSEADIIDLNTRLARTRWPEGETVTDWSQGVPLEYLKWFCLYWADTYNWRRRPASISSLNFALRSTGSASTSSTCAPRSRTPCRW